MQYSPPRRAVLETEHEWLRLSSFFREIIWMVGGGGKAAQNPWRRSAMGQVWKTAPKEYTITLQGLGSGTHPMCTTHPHACMVLTLRQNEGGCLHCTAPGCGYTTGWRPLAHLDEIFSPPGEHQPGITPEQWRREDTRVAWLRRTLHTYSTRPK